MRPITLATQTMFADLVQRTLDAEFDERYDERGRFKQRERKGRLYWHYVRNMGGKEREEYVGPVSDPEIDARVQDFAALKSDYKGRREMVRALIAAGLPEPDTMSAAVAEALWKGGFFRLRGVLVGTVAYQAYSGILGVRLPRASLQTQDIDVAQFYAISHEVGESMPPILELLRAVDPTFKPLPDQMDPVRVWRFRAANGFLVEFLTPNRGSDDYGDKPVDMPSLGGASALPLRHLDFLIHQPTRSVLLAKGGIPVTVPMPWVYAIHKLIVAAGRSGDVKASKDIDQAETLILACHTARRSYDLAEAWHDAFGRGPRWQEKLNRGASMMSDAAREVLKAMIGKEGRG